MLLWKRITELVVQRWLDMAPGSILKYNGADGLGDAIVLNYIATLVTTGFYVAPRNMRVTKIQGRVRVAGTGGACTITLYKAPSGTAIGSGVALHSGTYNLVGTADAVQTLTLSTTVGALNIAAGDAIGFVLTGTATNAVGNVTVSVTPR